MNNNYSYDELYKLLNHNIDSKLRYEEADPFKYTHPIIFINYLIKMNEDDAIMIYDKSNTDHVLIKKEGITKVFVEKYFEFISISITYDKKNHFIIAINE